MLISAKFFFGQNSNHFVASNDFSHFFEVPSCTNDHFVFNVGTPGLEARIVRLVNRIISMTEESKLISEKIPPNAIHC